MIMENFDMSSQRVDFDVISKAKYFKKLLNIGDSWWAKAS